MKKLGFYLGMYWDIQSGDFGFQTEHIDKHNVAILQMNGIK